MGGACLLQAVLVYVCIRFTCDLSLGTALRSAALSTRFNWHVEPQPSTPSNPLYFIIHGAFFLVFRPIVVHACVVAVEQSTFVFLLSVEA